MQKKNKYRTIYKMTQKSVFFLHTVGLFFSFLFRITTKSFIIILDHLTLCIKVAYTILLRYNISLLSSKRDT